MFKCKSDGRAVGSPARPDSDPIMIKGGCIDDVDRGLNPLGWFYRHNAMLAARWPMPHRIVSAAADKGCRHRARQ